VTDAGEMMATTTMTAASTGDDDNDNNNDNGTAMTTTTTTMASNNSEAIQKVLATFNSESQQAVEYVITPNEVLCEGYERAMNEKFASVIKEMKTTGETKSLVVIDRDYLKHLSEEFPTISIYVLVIVSYHVIAGARIHKQSAGINNIVGLLKDLKLMHKSDVIDDETHESECGIFTRCAIECEGLEGTDESPVGSIIFASSFATGKNYVIHKVKGGVKCLRDFLSGGVGMNDVHTICLYALLGNSTITVLLKDVFNLDMNGLVGDFLLMAAHEIEKRIIVNTINAT